MVLFHKVREVVDVKKKGYDVTLSKLFFFCRFEKDDVDGTIAYSHKLEPQTVTLQMYDNEVKDMHVLACMLSLHLRWFSSASPASSPKNIRARLYGNVKLSLVCECK